MTVRKTKPPQKTAVVWTKSDNEDGKSAINLLRRTGAKVEVRYLDSAKWKRSDVEAVVPGYTTLPQVVVDNAVVGDLAALKADPRFLPRLTKPMLDKAAKTAKGIADHAKWKTDRSAAAAARAVASQTVVAGRQSHPTDEQKAAALTRAVAAKAARAEHAAARVAAIKAARPART